jgi:hypothetical protein
MDNLYLILSTAANLVLIFLWIGELREKQYYFKCFMTWRKVAEENDQESADLLRQLNEIRANGIPAAIQRQINDLEIERDRLKTDLAICKETAGRLSLENSRMLRGVNQVKTRSNRGKL